MGEQRAGEHWRHVRRCSHAADAVPGLQRPPQLFTFPGEAEWASQIFYTLGNTVQNGPLPSLASGQTAHLHITFGFAKQPRPLLSEQEAGL
jgi:hypothetical protein